MNFWNDKELTVRMKNSGITEKEKFLYIQSMFGFLIFCTLLSLLVELKHWYGGERIISLALFISDLFSNLITYIIGIVGAWLCYETNKKGDNQSFIERVFCIGFPIIIKTTVLYLISFLIIGFGMGVFQAIFKVKEGVPEYIILCVVQTICTVFFFYRLNTCIRIIAYQDGP